MSEQVIEAVAERGERPVIPQDCPKALTDLILQCWEEQPERRPSSKTVVDKLHEILLEIEARELGLEPGVNESDVVLAVELDRLMI